MWCIGSHCWHFCAVSFECYIKGRGCVTVTDSLLQNATLYSQTLTHQRYPSQSSLNLAPPGAAIPSSFDF